MLLQWMSYAKIPFFNEPLLTQPEVNKKMNYLNKNVGVNAQRVTGAGRALNAHHTRRSSQLKGNHISRGNADVTHIKYSRYCFWVGAER